MHGSERGAQNKKINNILWEYRRHFTKGHFLLHITSSYESVRKDQQTKRKMTKI